MKEINISRKYERKQFLETHFVDIFDLILQNFVKFCHQAILSFIF